MRTNSYLSASDRNSDNVYRWIQLDRLLIQNGHFDGKGRVKVQCMVWSRAL